MPVRIVEGQKPYTAGPGIDIDANKVISLLLREENNLIYINDNDEAYVDLQLQSGLTPNSDFPVGVTVGKVLQADGWSKSGLVLNWKTTSGDYARWIYAVDGELYFDKGTGVRNQVYYSSEVDALLAELDSKIDEVADSIGDGQLTIQKNSTTVGTFNANQKLDTVVDIEVPLVIDNLTSTDTNNALSAYQGRVLKDMISSASGGLGRFLSLWNSSTGMPISFPLSIPYTYGTGDWFLVEVTGTTNYMPTGSSYTGTASTVVDSNTVEKGDVYIYDGNEWLLQKNTSVEVSFSNITGQPSDNTALASALNAKANDSDVVKLTGNQTVAGVKTFNSSPSVPTPTNNSDAATKKYVDDTASSSAAGKVSDTAYASSWNGVTGIAPSKNAVYDKINAMDTTIAGKQNTISDLATIRSGASAGATAVQPGDNISELNNDSGYITSAYHDSSKQDVLTAGTGISLTNNTVTNTGVTSVNGNTGAVTVAEFKATNGGVKIFDMPSVNGDMSAIIEWLTGGGDVILRTISSNVETYYTVIEWNGTNRTIKAENSSGSTVVVYTVTYSSAGVCTAVTNQSYSGGGDAKVFEISDLTSAASLATATQAYTYAYTNKKCAIIRYAGSIFVYSFGNTSTAYFHKTISYGDVSSGTWALMETLQLTVSSGSVTAIAQNTNRIVISTTEPASGTSNGTITLVI